MLLEDIKLKNIDICNSLAELRKKNGYTQMDLSRLTDLSQQYISNVERGVVIPSLPKAIRLAEALEVCYCEVFYACR